MNKLIVPVVIAAIVFGGVGFFGGMQYQKSQTPVAGARNFAGGNFSGTGASGATRRAGQNGGFVSGQIISEDSQSITIKITSGTSAGSTKIVLYSPATQIAKQTSGTAADLAVGSTVMVTGSTNSDGSISAQSISLRPTNPNGGLPGGVVPGIDRVVPTSGNPAPAPAVNAPGAGQ
jgi:hypothetical protein